MTAKLTTVDHIYPTTNTSYQHMEYHLEEDTQALWCYMTPKPRPCFSDALLDDMVSVQKMIENKCDPAFTPANEHLHYVVLGSKTPGVFSLGGDLELFARLIEAGDREALRTYAIKSIEVLYHHSVNYNRPMTTIALLEGDAIGAGFETALACDVIVAERHVKMGFPEVLFNLFPGMGAYSFLARRLDPAKIEKMILTGTIYSAEEMYEMGLVDILVDEGEGEAAVRQYIRKAKRSRNAREAVYRVRHRVNPVTFQELADIVEIWVDAAMQLEAINLRTMQRLIRAQEKKIASDSEMTDGQAVVGVG
ncbi:crotonase/enoyl-CoA hydratase family protein [Sulfuriflexus mobilis]|uniref:crotonase/enoyl-CoA hydratase family protein n=1 Tax=Sulfuriflexus mobilis TaxID=1811807 RepID=UPI001558459C|nr:crotonase/enoyl-CoA hydratase family protein [Sulfuriflexus mobilis]